MSNENTFTTRLGCDNCGHAETYNLPVRAIITNYSHDEREPSSYHFSNDPSCSALITCRHCKLPHLTVLWWKEEEVEVPHG